METQVSNHVRWAGFALPLAGLLALIGLVLRAPLFDALVDPANFIQAASAASFTTAWTLLMFAQIAEVFSYPVLYAYLAGPKSRVGTIAAIATAISFLGGGLYLALTGFFAYEAPVIAKLYLQGDKSVIDIAVAAFFGGPVLAILYPSGLLGLIGAILFGVAMWRTGRVAKWAAILYVLHLPLLTFPIGYIAELVGALFLLVSGAAIALSIWQQKTPVMSPGGEPSRGLETSDNNISSRVTAEGPVK
jgi:Ca2+/Na+ antiporter